MRQVFGSVSQLLLSKGTVCFAVLCSGIGTAHYSYAGKSTTVTDAAGKWKTSTVDVYGNLIQVTEPNPAGGTFLTNSRPSKLAV